MPQQRKPTRPMWVPPDAIQEGSDWYVPDPNNPGEGIKVKPPSAVGAGLHEARKQLIPSWDEFKGMLSSFAGAVVPMGDPTGEGPGLAGLGKSMIIDPIKQGLSQTQEHLSEGDYLGAGLHVAGGPGGAMMGMDTVHQISQPMPEGLTPEGRSAEIGSRVGAGGGLGLSMKNPGIGKSIRDKVLHKKPSGPTIPLPNGGRSSEVRMTRGEQTQSIKRLKAEHSVERTWPGMTDFPDFRAAQQAELAQIGEEVGLAIHSARMEGRDVGQAVAAAVVVGREQLKAQAQRLYDFVYAETAPTFVTKTKRYPIKSTGFGPTRYATKQVEEAVGGIRPRSEQIKLAVHPLLRLYKRVAKMVPDTDAEVIKNQLTALMKARPEDFFETYQTARSLLLKNARKFDAPVQGRRGGMANVLAEELDTALETALRDEGRLDVLGAWREANTLWKKLSDTFNEGILAEVTKASSEEIHSLIMNAPVEEILNVRAALPPPVYKMVQARIFRDMLEKASKYEILSAPGMAAAALGIPPTQNLQKLIGRGKSSLLQQLDDMGLPRARAIFNLKQLESIRALGSLSAAIDVPVNTWASAISLANRLAIGGGIATGVSLGVALGMGHGKSWSAIASTAATAGAIESGLKLASHAMTHPQGFTTLRAFVRAVSHQDAHKIMFLANRINQLGKEGQDKELNEELMKPTPPPPALGGVVPGGSTTAPVR